MKKSILRLRLCHHERILGNPFGARVPKDLLMPFKIASLQLVQKIGAIFNFQFPQ